VNTAEPTYRDGGVADLERTFAISERAVYDAAARQGLLPPGRRPTDADIRGDWLRQRGLIEFLAAQPGGRYCICERDGETIGYARLVRFEGTEQLTELMVATEHQGRGIGRELLRRCLPGPAADDRPRIVVAAGAPADLSLYTDFAMMPVAGHWHMRIETERYLAARAAQGEEATGDEAHVLEPDHAVAEWDRLEPAVLDRPRTSLHRFLARGRTCLACLDAHSGYAKGLCWVSDDGELGPAIGDSREDLAPVVLAALDRVARTREPEHLSAFATTTAWLLVRRLRKLGFRVWWPSWIMCSHPLPQLDRYGPTRPPHVL
jgi:GNAT superfamily N-acetyltransferase